jgi:protein tyrosine phosphatase (PTP) superfamily phosphohydrolase (DUF442 family)
MRVNPAFVCRSAAVLALLSSCVVAAAQATPPAQAPPPPALARIHIDNFGKVDDHYYRGAQPEGADYADLAALGVRTVIDLTEGGRSDEPGLARQVGMKFYRIPLTTWDRPADTAVAEFLRLVNDPANEPVYVHCQGGRHRTGVMTAVYRMTGDGWSADQAYGEMKQFHFEGFPGHPVLKRFVYDYYAQLDRARAAGSKAAPAKAPPK